jgi:hypothetical protein
MYDSARNEVVYSTATTTQGKTFVIDHPMDPQKFLVHACLEGPEAGVYYRGKDHIKSVTKVFLPEYTSILAKNFTVHLTPVGTFAKLYCSEVEDNCFTVYSDKPCQFNWVVYGERGSIVVEPYKNEVDIRGDGPYRWIR